MKMARPPYHTRINESASVHFLDVMAQLILLLWGLELFVLTGCSLPRTDDDVFIANHAEKMVIDGKLTEGAWQKAVFVDLTGTHPSQAPPEQTANHIQAAYLWDDAGLYFGMSVIDEDIQANKTKKNDWIWLEDVCELFLVKDRTGQSSHLELQVSPTGVRFEKRMLQFQAGEFPVSLKQPNSIPKYQVATYIDGSLNDSSHKDHMWSTEWFISWDDLRRVNLLCDKASIKPGQVVSYSRAANWNISIYSFYRVVRFTKPGRFDPHVVAFYRPIQLSGKK